MPPLSFRLRFLFAPPSASNYVGAPFAGATYRAIVLYVSASGASYSNINRTYYTIILDRYCVTCAVVVVGVVVVLLCWSIAQYLQADVFTGKRNRHVRRSKQRLFAVGFSGFFFLEKRRFSYVWLLVLLHFCVSLCLRTIYYTVIESVECIGPILI